MTIFLKIIYVYYNQNNNHHLGDKMNKKTVFKTLGLVAVSALSLFVATDVAMAQDLNAVTTQLTGQMPGVTNVLSAISYIAGVGFGIKGALKLKEHNESKGQVPISGPITLFIVAAILLALPTMLTTAKGTLFGTGSSATTLDGSNLRSIQ